MAKAACKPPARFSVADPSIERFRKVVASACAQLEARRQEVNDLNVFPVADGDTGDNMVADAARRDGGARPPERADRSTRSAATRS